MVIPQSRTYMSVAFFSNAMHLVGTNRTHSVELLPLTFVVASDYSDELDVFTVQLATLAYSGCSISQPEGVAVRMSHKAWIATQIKQWYVDMLV